MHSGADQRSNLRVDVALPVYLDKDLDKATGLTNNFSASGISFDTDAHYQPGSEISFVLDIETLTEKKQLRCRGRVVRSVVNGGKISVAASIDESDLV